MTPRPPQTDAVRWQEDGSVLLLSSPAPLSDVDARNIFLRRQTRFDFTAQADLCLPALKPGEEAGLVCYYDENTWLSCAAAGTEDGGYTFLVKEHIGKETTVCGNDAAANDASVSSAFPTAGCAFPVKTPGSLCRDDSRHLSADIPEAALHLRFTVTVRKLHRHFTVLELTRMPGQEPEASRILFEADCPNVYYLCDEGIKMGKRFTGAMIGVFGAGGSGQFRYTLERYREAD